jgi:signal transduction histidine kinase
MQTDKNHKISAGYRLHARDYFVALSFLSIIGLGVAWWGAEADLADEVKRLTSYQLESVLRVGIKTKNTLDLRALVELLSAEFHDSRIRASTDSARFDVGSVSHFPLCVSRSYSDLSELSATGGDIDGRYLSIEICKARPVPLTASLGALFLVLFSLLIFYRLSKRAEDRAVKSFNDFLVNQGVGVPALEHLDDLFPLFEQLDAALKDRHRMQVRLTREETYSSLATELVHDLAPLLTTLKFASDQTTQRGDAIELVRGVVERLDQIRTSLLSSRKFGQAISGPRSLLCVSVFEMVRAAATSLFVAKYGHSRGLRFTGLDADASQGIVVTCESSKLRSVVENLLVNAFEAKREDQPFAEIGVSFVTNDRFFSIAIRDQGRGIDKELQKLLFMKGSTFNKPEGNGLGLYQAKMAVESWGGTISIESVPQQFTEVKISLCLEGC